MMMRRLLMLLLKDSFFTFKLSHIFVYSVHMYWNRMCTFAAIARFICSPLSFFVNAPHLNGRDLKSIRAIIRCVLVIIQRICLLLPFSAKNKLEGLLGRMSARVRIQNQFLIVVRCQHFGCTHRVCGGSRFIHSFRYISRAQKEQWKVLMRLRFTRWIWCAAKATVFLASIEHPRRMVGRNIICLHDGAIADTNRHLERSDGKTSACALKASAISAN